MVSIRKLRGHNAWEPDLVCFLRLRLACNCIGHRLRYAGARARGRTATTAESPSAMQYSHCTTVATPLVHTGQGEDNQVIVTTSVKNRIRPYLRMDRIRLGSAICDPKLRGRHNEKISSS
jgi:hypothetical protein